MKPLDLRNILVVQTAFLGDVILTVPLVQSLKHHFPSAAIDIVVIPRSAELLEHHPAIRTAVIFDKRGKDAGLKGLLRLSKELCHNNYDLAVVPHRSFRSALLVRMAKIPRRIGFNRSSGKFFFTDVVRYVPTLHEVDRNAKLLEPLGVHSQEREFPQLFPSRQDDEIVDRFLLNHGITTVDRVVGVAPGTIWNTKRWLQERFIEVIKQLTADNLSVVLVGGSDDAEVCRQICEGSSSSRVYSAAGTLSLLQSASLIKRCRVLLCNDSAPMHLAVAMHTPVVSIFGATVPEFGFAPYGKYDVVVEIKGLPCRPCTIHGGDRCPIRTFDCMNKISSDMVYEKVLEVLKASDAIRRT